MKKILAVMALGLAALLMHGCGASNDAKLKEEIVGSYNYSDVVMEGEDLVSMQARYFFKEDGTTKIIAVIDYSTEMGDLAGLTDLDDELSLLYYISISGTYDIKKSVLTLDYDLDNMRFELEESNAGFLTETLDAVFAPMALDYIIPMLANMGVKGKLKIAEITEGQMKIEADGGEMKYERLPEVGI